MKLKGASAQANAAQLFVPLCRSLLKADHEMNFDFDSIISDYIPPKITRIGECNAKL